MNPKRLTPRKLGEFIEHNGLRAVLLELDVPTPTVDAAAKAVGVEPSQIIKSLLFRVRSEPVLVIARGPTKVDRRRLAKHFGVGRKQIKLLAAQEVLEISGYPIGAVPPFGHKQKLKTLMEESIFQDAEVYAGGGAENMLMRVTPPEIQEVTGATLLALQAPNSQTPGEIE